MHVWLGSQVVWETTLECLSWLYLILEYTYYKQRFTIVFHIKNERYVICVNKNVFLVI